MRRTLVGLAAAVTSMVALAFLIPLALLVRSEVRTQATTAAEQRAAALAPVLTLTANAADVRAAMASLDPGGNLAVRLPNGDLVGAAKAPGSLVLSAVEGSASIARNVPGGWVYLQPVVLARGQVAVVEAFVPQADLSRGVESSWAVMSVLAVGLVLGSVLVADRLGARVVRSSRGLSQASAALGAGDLDSRVDPMGPPELREAGLAFNAMADRVLELLAVERELVADLSHRLRTPLTALRLASERIGAPSEARSVTTAVRQLEAELDSIITAARTPLAVGPMGLAFPSQAESVRGRRPGASAGCEAGDVVRKRAGFWQVLAGHQSRPCSVFVTTEPAPVALTVEDLTAVVDALVGNVFRHTEPGTAFAVRLERAAQAVTLIVEDAGPGSGIL